MWQIVRPCFSQLQPQEGGGIFPSLSWLLGIKPQGNGLAHSQGHTHAGFQDWAGGRSSVAGVGRCLLTGTGAARQVGAAEGD